MRITSVEPILLRGEQGYGSTAATDEITDNGDWQLLVRVATDEGLIDLVPHSWLTHLLTGYSLQLIATLPRARYVEFNVSQSALTRGIARAAFALAPDGTVAIPDLPGIGVEVDEEFVRAHRVN